MKVWHQQLIRNVIIENSKIEEEKLITFVVKLGKIMLKTANMLCEVAGHHNHIKCLGSTSVPKDA